jgi:hypothetical protein
MPQECTFGSGSSLPPARSIYGLNGWVDRLVLVQSKRAAKCLSRSEKVNLMVLRV